MDTRCDEDTGKRLQVATLVRNAAFAEIVVENPANSDWPIGGPGSGEPKECVFGFLPIHGRDARATPRRGRGADGAAVAWASRP